MVIARTRVRRDVANLGHFESKFLRHLAAEDLCSPIAAPAPVHQHAAHAQQWRRILQNDGCGRERPGEHRIVAADSLLPSLDPLADDVGVPNLDVRAGLLEELAATPMALNEVEPRRGKRHGQRETRKAGARSQVADTLRRAKRLQLERNEGVRQVDVHCLICSANGRRGVRAGLKHGKGPGELLALARAQRIALREPVQRGI